MSRGAQRNEVYAYPVGAGTGRQRDRPSRPPPTRRSPGSAGSRPTATARPGRRPGRRGPGQPSWPGPSAATAPNCRRPRPGSRRCRTPTTSACCTRSGWSTAAPRRTPGTPRRCASTLPPADAEEVLKDTDVLWRTVRAAELAGLDGAGRSSGRRSQAGRSPARDRTQRCWTPGSVTATGDLPPRVRESWRRACRRLADPELARYLAEVAAAMDDRQRRIGEHAAQERPLWATQALGPVPPNRRARGVGAAGRATRRLPGDHRLGPSR